MKKIYQYSIAAFLVLIIFVIIIYLIGYSFDLGRTNGYENGYNDGVDYSVNTTMEIVLDNCINYWCNEISLNCSEEADYLANKVTCVQMIYNNPDLNPYT